MDNFLAELRELAEKVGKKEAKRLKLKRMERVVALLQSQAECEHCGQLLHELGQHLGDLVNSGGQLEKEDLNRHYQKLEAVVSHLQKCHQMVSEGHYVSIYLSLGLALGVSFGLTIFDNLALGLAIGLSLGVAVGTAKDEAAKKKGLQI